MENILVIGHSRCGGIQALMGMEEVDSRFLLISYFNHSSGKKKKKHFSIVDFCHIEFSCKQKFHT